MILINTTLQTIVLISLAGLLFTNCEKNDNFGHLKTAYQYRGSFSIPVATSEITLREMGINLPEGWQDFPSLLKIPEKIEFGETYPFNPEAVTGNVSRIKQVEFRIRTQNEFPSRIVFNLYLNNGGFLNEPLFDKPIIIEPANTNDSGKYINSKKNLNNYILLSERVIAWKSVSTLQLIGYVENKNVDIMKYNYYNEHTLYFELGMRLDFDFNTDSI